ncbi:MAG: glycogen debranching enzyme GlgX [Spirochaetae bacterium HGW-Spirochaetae-1]|jgi:glycogen operon protein|nr:MAG: glycogen debranching enzyme GlgX [Spirochaetae bacterium HGW-Spirochaetae-1]
MLLDRATLITSPGSPLPLGADTVSNGVQFSIFSRNATSVTLVLFSGKEHKAPYIEIELDPFLNKTGDIWHIWIEGLREGQQYGYRIDGPHDPLRGHRFNKNKLLLDPYARAVTDNFIWDLTKARGCDINTENPELSISDEDSVYYVPRSIVIDNKNIIEDRQLITPPHDTIIYEMHVRGFTVHSSSDTEYPGTYKGITEKIPYLKELGVTAVELLPVQEFDGFENINVNPETGERLRNYWGYSTMAFFAPKAAYSSTEAMGLQIVEFKEMVKALHDAGIEVILDVVFNHTAEGDHRGPTISFRGIDNSIYYMLDDEKQLYRNYSGCGNTFNCNHPLVRNFILDCLRYWAVEMNIDGFRFDLASILGRDQAGNILSNPPLIEHIEEDPILRNTKIIAEAWDAAGAYQVGDFPGRWQEWNGRYRDDVRRFWRGDPNCVGAFATRLCGSSDLYEKSEKGPCRSINFITCHDGFTLNDLVSYREKHNEANGEENRDGENYNLSDNFGVEGPSSDPDVEELRLRQIKNFLATLFLSQGIPMLLAGDEFRRTQQGNNNTYCQDNELSWIDWSFRDKNDEVFRFTREIMRFRKEHPLLRKREFFSGNAHDGFSVPDITWHGVKSNEPDWTEESRTIAALLCGKYAKTEYGACDADLYLIFNASDESQFYEIPPAPSGAPWKIAMDTSLSAPHDIAGAGREEPLTENRYYVKKLSTVVLVSGT